MENLLVKVGEWLIGKIDEILGMLVPWMTEILFAPLLESFLDTGTEMYNAMLTRAMEIMTMSPDEWNAPGWEFIANEVNFLFVSIGCVLTVIFFLMGFCAESVDLKAEIRLETILKMSLKLSFAEFFVVNSLKIVTDLFKFVGAMTTFRMNGDNGDGIFRITVDVSKDDLLSMSWGPAILTLLLALVCMVALIISGAVITYTAYMRFFKILLLIPYGAIASSTIAGNHTLHVTATSFWKYAIGTVLEGVTMIVALFLFAHIEMNGGISFIALENASKELILAGELLDKTLLALLCLGVIKGVGALQQKALAL